MDKGRRKNMLYSEKIPNERNGMIKQYKHTKRDPNAKYVITSVSISENDMKKIEMMAEELDITRSAAMRKIISDYFGEF